MNRALRIAIPSVTAGATLTLASAWVPMYFLGGVPAAFSASSFWPIDDKHIGGVSALDAPWLPVEREIAGVAVGGFVNSGAYFDGPGVKFIGPGCDDVFVGITPSQIRADAPAWARGLSVSDDPGTLCSIERLSTGWPSRCFEGFVDYHREHSPVAGIDATPTSAVRHLYRRRSELFPCFPLPLGLAVNVLVWSGLVAGAWTLAMSGPRAVITASRRRRNRCIACGYSRAGLSQAAPCPECSRPFA